MEGPQASSFSDTAFITVDVLDVVEGFLPSSDYLSPNGDGINDYWKVANVELYNDYSLTIFNDHGEEVYAIDNNYANDWDGTYQGDALPSGTYYYLLKNAHHLHSHYLP